MEPGNYENKNNTKNDNIVDYKNPNNPDNPLKVQAYNPKPYWIAGVGNNINSIAMSSDGTYIVAGTYDNDRVWFFNKTTSSYQWVYDVGGTVRSVDISSNGRYVVAGSDSNSIFLFKNPGPTLMWSNNTGNRVTSVAISSDGRFIAAGTAGNHVYLFKNSSSIALWRFNTGSGINSVSISSDGQYIAAGNYAGFIYLFSNVSSTPLWSYYSSDTVNSVSISSDGQYIAAGNNNGDILYFNKSNSEPVWSYNNIWDINKVDLSSDGKYLVAGGWGDTVYLFINSSSTPLWSYDTGDTVNSVSISSDGQYIVAGGDGNDLYLFNKTSSNPIWVYKTSFWINDVVISSDGRYIAAGTLFSDARLYFLGNIPPKQFVLTSNAETPDTDGQYNLTWTNSLGADDYSLYSYNYFISEINESLTLIQENIIDLNYSISNSINGDYYYIVVACNESGYILSNCIKITVNGNPGPFQLSTNAEYPDIDGNFNLTWTSSERALNYSVYVFKQYITEINETTLEICHEITDTNFTITDLYSGDYYYIVEAHNTFGNNYSNCIYININRNPKPFLLSSNAGKPDNDGNFNLTWTISEGADNYTVYMSDYYITEINSRVSEVEKGITDLNYTISNLNNSRYFYLAVAYNETGYTYSNCINVSVKAPPRSFSLSSNADYPDNNGKFDLYWTNSTDANNYTIYQYHYYISEINNSLTVISKEINKLNQFIHITQDGIYYFIIEAHNDYGNTTSNCIQVTITLGPPGTFSLTSDAENPDIGCFFNLTWDASIGTENYSIYIHDKYITEINETVIEFKNNITEIRYLITTLFDGTYYFKVIAFNDYGNSSSNCIDVNIINGMIYIDGDNDFKWSYAVKSGLGTLESPYIISDWSLNRLFLGGCIFVKNTTKFFEIKNCTLTNGIFGIKIENSNNFKIYNNTLNNLKGNNGTDGINYQDNNDGTDGDNVIGIYIENCIDFNLTNNDILNFIGGKGGNGGIGKDNFTPGGKGGNGGSAICILINNSINFDNSYNNFKNIKSGNGGTGGHGYEGISSLFIGYGSDGGSGGAGGSVICINLDNSNNFYHLHNNFYNITGGKGGNGGKGGDGQPTPGGWPFIWSSGGDGANGGKGGSVIAINHQNSINITNSMNTLKMFSGGSGGDGGEGGVAHGGAAGIGGNGGNGGIGGNVVGFSYTDSYNITNILNNFMDFISGNAGEGGNGGRGPDGVYNVNSGDAERGGNGGSGGQGGDLYGIYLFNSSKILNQANYFYNFSSGSGLEGGNGGDGGNGTNIGDGGDGGNGGHGGNGGSLIIIYGEFTNNSYNYYNKICRSMTGYGGNGSTAGNGGNGVSGGIGGDGGHGGDGGDTGNFYGFYIEGANNIIIYNNNITYIYEAFSGIGGDGGNGGSGSTTGNSGNGGDGGSGKHSCGIYLMNITNSMIFSNNITHIMNNKGRPGGDIGTGIGISMEGVNGTDYQGCAIYLLSNSMNNGINNNNMSFNSIGIMLEGNCDNNIFTENIIHNNTLYGVIIYNRLGECNSNIFYMNIFSNPEGINAYDNGTDTIWDIAMIGNWWHDYLGDDNDDDGIGDTPYSILGYWGNRDNYPIWDDGPEKIKPNIVFVNPLLNNTQITLSLYTIIVNVTDHHPPTEGNVILYIFNTTYDLLFNDTMEFESNTLWSFSWDNISSYNHLTCILKIQVFDSAFYNNMNWSLSMYINVNIADGNGSSDNGGGGGGDNRDKGESDISSFLMSPIGIGVVIVSGITASIIVIYIKKVRTYKSSNKEKERLVNL